MTVMKRLPIGVSDFAKMIDLARGYYYIDRTLWIKTLLDDGDVVVFHAIRRSGKSLMLSMLQTFLAQADTDSRSLFTSMAINQQAPELMTHQGKYPVIRLSFKSVNKASFAESKRSFWHCIKLAYTQHTYLREHLDEVQRRDFDRFYDHDSYHDDLNVDMALQQLMGFLRRYHGQRVWVLIDEYDAPVVTAYRHGYLQDWLQLYQAFLSAALKDNDDLERAVMVGILRIAKDSLLSGLNQVKVYSMHDPGPYKPYFAFAEEEAQDLIRTYLPCEQVEAIKAWYNGYRIGGMAHYNPWSLLMCMDKRGRLGPYWENTADDGFIRDTLMASSQNVQCHFERLLAYASATVVLEERVYVEGVADDHESLFSLLFACGYLTLLEDKANAEGAYVLCLPNQEIRWAFKRNFLKVMRRVKPGSNMALLRAIRAGDLQTFKAELDDYIARYTSINHLKYEGAYHSLVVGMIFGLQSSHYVYPGTLEAGDGFSDLLLLPKPGHGERAMILEFKRSKVAGRRGEIESKRALAQIDNRRYEEAFAQHAHIEAVIKVGLVFAGKRSYMQVRHEACLLEEA